MTGIAKADKHLQRAMDSLIITDFILFMQNNGAWVFKNSVNETPTRMSSEEIKTLKTEFINSLHPKQQ